MTQAPRSIGDLFAHYGRVTNAALVGNVDLNILSEP